MTTETDPKHAFHSLRVARVIDETPDAKSIVFEIPPALAETFKYRSGQFLTFELPLDTGPLRRCYSLASSPQHGDAHKVTVKRVAYGRGSNFINDRMREGDAMRVLPPEGRFLLTGTNRPLLLFAGGSGITPIISLLKTTLVTTERRARLVYANRDQRSIIFHAEIGDLLRRFEGRFTVTHRLDDRDGFIKERDVSPLVAGLEEGEAYVCGPAAFMETLELGLHAAGVQEERVHFERFLSLPDLQPHKEHVTSAAEVAGAPETIDVTLRGKKYTIPFVAGKTLLRTALDAGLDAPYSCEEGFCGTCVAQLEEGQVKMDANDALTKVEMKRGLVLACQSHPLTKRCAIQFVD